MASLTLRSKPRMHRSASVCCGLPPPAGMLEPAEAGRHVPATRRCARRLPARGPCAAWGSVPCLAPRGERDTRRGQRRSGPPGVGLKPHTFSTRATGAVAFEAFLRRRVRFVRPLPVGRSFLPWALSLLSNALPHRARSLGKPAASRTRVLRGGAGRDPTPETCGPPWVPVSRCDPRSRSRPESPARSGMPGSEERRRRGPVTRLALASRAPTCP